MSIAEIHRLMSEGSLNQAYELANKCLNHYSSNEHASVLAKLYKLKMSEIESMMTEAPNTYLSNTLLIVSYETCSYLLSESLLKLDQ